MIGSFVPVADTKHYMLWLIASTCTNWRISHRLVNTFFTIFGIDFGLTGTEDTRGGDSAVDALGIALWITIG